jgi:long-chain fatty acid transport protein
MTKYQYARPLLAAAGMLLASQSHGAAFELKERSAKAQGRAYAGSISTPGDAAAMADNPAAMSGLEGRVFQADLTAVDYSVKFSGDGADALGRPLAGGNGGDAGATKAVPAMYLHLPLNARTHLGVSLTAPFGFKTEYDAQWKGRYQGQTTELKTINLGVALAYNVNDALSLGGALSVEHAQAKLATAVDFGAILAGARVPGYAPASADGRITIDGSDNAIGFTIGALYRPNQQTRIGLAYRARVKHTLGDVPVGFDVPPGPKAIFATTRPGWFTDTAASTQLRMPAAWMAGITHRLDERWLLMADVRRTQWRQFQDVELDFHSPQPAQVIAFDYRNTSFGALGTEYTVDDSLVLRSGVAYDQTPVRNGARDVRVPDVNRKWLAFGATWRASPSLEYSVGYTHLFLDKPSVDLRSPTASTVRGSYSLTSDMLAVALAYRF